jgi:hypothetical protein
MAMIHVSRSGATLGVFEEEKVREGLRTGEFIGTDLGWMEGMPTWRPLSDLDSFRNPPPPPPPPQSSTAPEAAQPLATTTTPAAATAPLRTGLPWENREGRSFFNALFDTISLIFTKPAEAFSIMRREGGFGDPLIYALILGCAGGLVSIGFNTGIQSLGLMSERNNALGALFGMGFGIIAMIFLLPIVIIIGMFIGAAITHLCLMLVGGAKQPYETTFRVLCYGGGTGNLLQMIPFCGGFAALIANLIFSCIGLARAHETDTWRALVAILLPMILCCGAIVFLVFAFIGAIAGTNWH